MIIQVNGKVVKEAPKTFLRIVTIPNKITNYITEENKNTEETIDTWSPSVHTATDHLGRVFINGVLQ